MPDNKTNDESPDVVLCIVCGFTEGLENIPTDAKGIARANAIQRICSRCSENKRRSEEHINKELTDEELEDIFTQFDSQIPDWVHPVRFIIRSRLTDAYGREYFYAYMRYLVPKDVNHESFKLKSLKFKYPVYLSDWLESPDTILEGFRRRVVEEVPPIELKTVEDFRGLGTSCALIFCPVKELAK